MTIQDRLDQSKDAILAAYAEGVGTAQLGRQYDCNSGTIWLFLKRHGVEPRKRNSNYGTLEKRWSEIEQLVAADWSAYAIAKHLGCGKCSVLRLLEQHGVDMSAKSTQREDPLRNHVDEIVQLYKDGNSTCQIAGQFNCENASIWTLLQEQGVVCRDRAKYSCDESFFDTIDTEAKAYILGWFYSDGNNFKNGLAIRLEIADLDILEGIKDAMQSTGPFWVRQPRKSTHRPLFAMTLHSKRLSEALTAKGCPPNKTFVVRFPGPDIVPTHLVHHFVRGYFDGDGSFGCYGKHHRWVVQIVGTRHLLDGVLAASGVRGVFHQRHPERNKDNWTLMIPVKGEMDRFLTWLYRDATVFLARKHSKYLRFAQAV